MQVYLVGGAVRDELLGRPVAERDWVVVGATPEEMERLGYRPVGRDFPVYLHPQTHEEYALARRERKVAPGYRGFTTQFSPQVSLEEDLQRRDLTINAMARDTHDRLIDPFGGQADVERRLLRHVSPAFVEDPVRILRVARFAARFAGLGFSVAPETLVLMRHMVDNGEVHALVPERVWRELERALAEPQPEACFETLQACGALAVLLPELQWSEHERRALQYAVSLSADPAVRFAALLGSLAQPTIDALAQRLRVPNEYRELALLTARLGTRLAQAAQLDAAGLLDLLEAADALRRGERFRKLLLATEATTAAASSAAASAAATPSATPSATRGASAASSAAVPAFPAKLLETALTAAGAVALPADELARLRGPTIAQALRAAREQRLEGLRRELGQAPSRR